MRSNSLSAKSVDHLGGFDAVEGFEFHFLEIGEAGTVFDFNSAGGGNDVKMIFEFFEYPDAHFGDVGQIVDDDGVFFGLSNLDGQLAESLDTFAVGYFVDEIVFTSDAGQHFQDFLLFTVEEFHDQSSENSSCLSQIIDADNFCMVVIIQ